MAAAFPARLTVLCRILADMAEVWKKKALQLNAEREGSRVPQTEER